MCIWLCLILFYVQTPCSENPCKNGATCIPSYSDDKFKCKCAAGFKGKKCDKGKLRTEHGPHSICSIETRLGGFQVQGIRTVREMIRDLHTNWTTSVGRNSHTSTIGITDIFANFGQRVVIHWRRAAIFGDQRRFILTFAQAIAQHSRNQNCR